MRLAPVILYFAALAACKPTVYLIRHGEKPHDKRDTGLSAQGEERAQCLREIFGASSDYKIDYIMAQRYKRNGKRKRPYDTVLPLADDLGLTVDTSCDRNDSECVANVVNNYSGNGNILICWQHGAIRHIAKELGVYDVRKYPKKRYDVIWNIPFPYTEVTEDLEYCRIDDL